MTNGSVNEYQLLQYYIKMNAVHFSETSVTTCIYTTPHLDTSQGTEILFGKQAIYRRVTNWHSVLVIKKTEAAAAAAAAVMESEAVPLHATKAYRGR
jgi:hypothetical protein